MVADDLVVCGAEPLFMTDYLVFGKVVPERVAAVVAGIAAGCEQAGCALLGGRQPSTPGISGRLTSISQARPRVSWRLMSFSAPTAYSPATQ